MGLVPALCQPVGNHSNQPYSSSRTLCLCVRVQLEAIPESLKNMLLVMDTAGIFHSADSRTGFSDLWEITWERIVCFLPHLKEELFKQTIIAGTPRGGVKGHSKALFHACVCV